MSSPPATRWPTPPPIYETPATAPTTLRPYLTLPYLLSLTWLAYPILSLLFVAFRLQLSLGSAEDVVSDAKNNLLTSCKAAETAATAAASLPRFMAVGTNKQIVDAVNGTMNGAREALILALTVMEAIINFIVDIYRSTFLCFLELVIRGGLAILIGAVQELQQFVQNTLGSVRTSIQNDVAGANSAIATAVNGINKVLPFGANINVPQFNIPSLDALNNVTLPTDFEDALTKLNASIPSLDELRDKIDAIIDTPFELVKKDINDTFLGFSFNQSTLPVPELNTLSFCGDLDTGIVDDLGHELIKVARIGTIILIVLALLLLAGNCLLEWYQWRTLKRSLENTRLAWASDPTVYHVSAVSSTPSFHMTDHNLLTLNATSSHPLLSRIANKISSLFHLSSSQHIHLQFFFHYIFHPPALACFLIGFFGLLSVELQLLALGPVQAKFSSQVSASVAGFSNTIADSMNASMQNQSALYADSINDQVSTMQNGINNGLFSWVNGTTTTLNDTLNTFYTDIQGAVTTVFGGTILDQPAQEFVRCIIGTKVEAFENALTFLHDNLHVSLPIMNQSALVLSQDQVDEATKPISLAAVGGGADDNGGLVGRLVDRYANGLRKERVMFSIFIGLWGLVVLMALCIIFWHSYGKGWAEMHRRRKWRKEQSGGADTAVRPWSHVSFTNPAPRQLSNEKMNDLPSFAPMGESEKSGFFAALRRSASDAPRMAEQRSDHGEDIGHSHSSGDGSATRRKSNKLMAIGRKAMGKEVLVKNGDAERQATRSQDEIWEVEVREEKGSAWWQRLWKSRGSNESLETGLDRLQPRQGNEQRRTPYPNPNLTISTNITLPKSQRDRYPVIVQEEPHVRERPTPDMPSSAWSISPEATRPTPWTRPLPFNTLPLRPKPRPNANLPQSVDSTYGPSALTLQGMAPSKAVPTPAPAPARSVPIHHEFVRPIPPGTPSSPSPPPSPEPKATLMLAPPAVNHQGRSTFNSAPSAHHVRSSSGVLPENPFATCFDDEYRVQPERHSARLSTTNPFADVGTPRAV